jgi:hypothetical protein
MGAFDLAVELGRTGLDVGMPYALVIEVILPAQVGYEIGCLASPYISTAGPLGTGLGDADFARR